MSPAFELDGVSKTYWLWRRLKKTAVPGVRDVRLAVPRGVIFGLLGLNGAGKTTAMKLLVGIMQPDAGAVRVLGGDVRDPQVRAKIGFLPELPYVPLQMGAAELLRCYGRMSGLAGKRLESRVAAALETAGLDRGRTEPLRTFSKGMLQRVALAQVLLHEPEVIFADEPMSGLDPAGVREMRELLMRLRDAGLTVCINSHQIAEVERLCDRVGVMAGGRLVREGTVGELLALAGTRRYRLVVLAKGAQDWEIGDLEVGEDELADTLQAQRSRGARVLQILAQQGSLEEVLLTTIRQAGGPHAS
ncbi:MAG: ABC transporter ATP-binding protein [Candidatus Coatesbacteria bacterium]